MVVVVMFLFLFLHDERQVFDLHGMISKENGYSDVCVLHQHILQSDNCRLSFTVETQPRKALISFKDRSESSSDL